MIAVDGIGGVFLKANDPGVLKDWYARHFGLEFADYGNGSFGLEFFYTTSGTERKASTIFSIQKSKSPLPSPRLEVVVNWRVNDLPAFLEQLRSAGIAISKTEEGEYGRFAWIEDPEGNPIELYQPPVEPATP